MKQLIVNNKLNMDICVLLGCYERENQEEYYGTFDECVAAIINAHCVTIIITFINKCV